MSYDVWAEIDTGGSEPAHIHSDLNYTSNVSGMWDKAMPALNLRDMNHKQCGECIPHLQKGVAAMEADAATFEAMNPANGWGNSDGAVKFLRDVLALCLAHPKAMLRVSR